MTSTPRLQVELACEMSCNACEEKISRVIKEHFPSSDVLDINSSQQKVVLSIPTCDNVSVNDIQQKIEALTSIKTVIKGVGDQITVVSELRPSVHKSDILNGVIGVVRMAQLTGSDCIVDGVVGGLDVNDRTSLNVNSFGDFSGKDYENVGPVLIPLKDDLQVNQVNGNKSSFRFTVPQCDVQSLIGRSMTVKSKLMDKILAAGIIARSSPVGLNSVKKVCACSGQTLWDERVESQQQQEVNKRVAVTFDLKSSNFKQGTTSEGLKVSFDEILKSNWIKAQSNGAFKYIVTEDSLQTRVIDGKYKFIASFNENRGSLRRKPQNVVNLRQKFDPNLFNFTKLSSNEVLFDVTISGLTSGFPKSGLKVSMPPLQATIVVNNSPIEFGSSLIVPFLNNCSNQVLTLEAIKIGLIISLVSDDPFIRIGFNSLGACASVNHLHLHVYYLKHVLLIEDADFDTKSNLLLDWPIKGFVYEIDSTSNNLISDINDVSRQVFKLISICLDMDQPHNVFITRSSKRQSVVRIIFWPREPQYGLKNDMELAAAFCEFSGFFICKTKSDYETLSEAACIDLMANLDTKIDEIMKQLVE